MKNMNKIMMILVAILAITTAMTPAWGQTATEFGYCYDVSRWPVWPNTTEPTQFSGFGNPLVANNLTSDGPWKLEFYENYNASNISTYGFDASTVSDLLSAYNVTTMPVYKLYRKVNNNDQFVSYVVLCAYSSVNNTNGHTAFLSKPVSGYYGGIGCLLSGNQHNSGDLLNITVDGDMKSGFPSEITTTNYTLTLSSNNTQYGTVSAVGAGNGTVNNNNVTYTVPAGTQVTVKATEETGYHFSSWSDNGDKQHQITVNGNTSLSATFAINTYTLQLNKNINNAGTVTANATSGISGNNPYTVNHNTSVSIEATASTGYRFVNWDDNVATNPRSITVTSNVTRTANFVREYTITLSTNNNYGTVSITGTGVVNKGNGQYAVPEGNTITITANPNTGSHFVNWDGNQTLTNPSRQITVSSNQTITANFDYKIYNMPSQWTVKANNESVNVTSGTTDGIQDGKTVKITPAPGQKILTVKMKKKTN